MSVAVNITHQTVTTTPPPPPPSASNGLRNNQLLFLISLQGRSLVQFIKVEKNSTAEIERKLNYPSIVGNK